MKTIHVHIAVDDLKRNIDFYSALFKAEPVVVKQDYAKWKLDDPRVNLSITTKQGAKGVQHLGIEVEKADELKEIYERVHTGGHEMQEEGHTVCCYFKSEKGWVTDPQQVSWELFHTYGESETYNKGISTPSEMNKEEGVQAENGLTIMEATACCSGPISSEEGSCC